VAAALGEDRRLRVDVEREAGLDRYGAPPIARSESRS